MSSTTAPKTIDLGGALSVQREAVAGGTILPGMLVERTTAELIVAHDDADNQAAPMFAVENDMIGKGITDAYASGDQVFTRFFPQGAGVYARLASGQNITKGALLTSNGDGYLKAAGGTSYIIAIARESVDATAGAKFIRVEIILGKAAAGAE
jgi:hypothetical protein